MLGQHVDFIEQMILGMTFQLRSMIKIVKVVRETLRLSTQVSSVMIVVLPTLLANVFRPACVDSFQ